MGAETAIEWCDATFNPWIGCTRVSRACDDCYAARSTPARTLGIAWGAGQPRRRTGDDNWAQPKRWAKTMPARLGRRPRVFCSSLADWLDNEVPIEWLVDLLDLIRCTPELDWLLLSKRIGNWQKRISEALHVVGQRPGCLIDPLFQMLSRWLRGEPPLHVWLGATVVNREEMLRDGPKLKAAPARVHFWSVEPMLGDLGKIPLDIMPDWGICGGESGAHARPMHPVWLRSYRDQFARTGRPWLFKQWGEWLPIEVDAPGDGRLYAVVDDGSERDITTLNKSGRSSYDIEVLDGGQRMARVGKKVAGRMLDGRTHDEFPHPPGQHVMAADCWCEPTVAFQDGDTGARVLVHRRSQ